jgi:signal transduction histidine kinase/ActR/RegA family two-component response regulator
VALARILRDTMVAEKSFLDRVQCATEIAGSTLGADLTAVFRFYENGVLIKNIDTYQRDTDKHFVMMDIRTPDAPTYQYLQQGDYAQPVRDITRMGEFGARAFLEALNIRSTLTIGVLSGPELAGQVFFGMVGAPRTWTPEDIAFARSVGSFITNFFANEQRNQLQERLQQAARMEAIGQLAGGVAHDFNNILGAIMGFSSFLMQDLPEGSELHGFASRIMAASDRGKELVDQVLTFARTRGPDADTADLGRALRQNTELVRGSFPSSVSIEVEQAPDDIWVRCGAAKLSQLLLNIAINARDAIGSKPGVIRVAVTKAPGSELQRLAGRNDPNETSIGEPDFALDYACVRVSDTGGGVAPENLKHIFEPFYTTKGRQRGTGLGLAVVHGVIESCGGFCHVTITPGTGAEFALYLPLAQRGSAMPEPMGALTTRGSERVLVVDDEPDIVDAMVIGLERLGYGAVGVSDPMEALAAFEEDPHAFDIVVTDLAMPSLRGNELIGKIKAIRPDIRAILCTAFSDGTITGSDHNRIADAAFHKPVNAAAISACIRELVQTSRSQQ